MSISNTTLQNVTDFIASKAESFFRQIKCSSSFSFLCSSSVIIAPSESRDKATSAVRMSIITAAFQRHVFVELYSSPICQHKRRVNITTNNESLPIAVLSIGSLSSMVVTSECFCSSICTCRTKSVITTLSIITSCLHEEPVDVMRNAL